MNYAEFSLACGRLLERYPQDMLMMSGIVGDNATRYVLESTKGTPKHNREADLLGHVDLEGDFIWKGAGINNVTVAGWDGGGHPALAGTSVVYCAGRIESYGFFFHSGHYHPTVENAIPFLCDFIENSCAGQMGLVKNQTAERLTKLKLRFYQKGSSTKTYYTTFTELAIEHRAYELPVEIVETSLSSQSMMSLHSSAMAMPTKGSSPMSMHKSPPLSISSKSHVSTMSSSSHVSTSSSSSSHSSRLPQHRPPDLGITTTGQFLHNVPRVPSGWMPDSEVSRCMLCQKGFGMMTRKHHCRKCGGIFCSTCSDKTAIVRKPATKPKEIQVDVTSGPVRVCRTCSVRLDL